MDRRVRVVVIIGLVGTLMMAFIPPEIAGGIIVALLLYGAWMYRSEIGRVLVSGRRVVPPVPTAASAPPQERDDAAPARAQEPGPKSEAQQKREELLHDLRKLRDAFGTLKSNDQDSAAAVRIGLILKKYNDLFATVDETHAGYKTTAYLHLAAIYAVEVLEHEDDFDEAMRNIRDRFRSPFIVHGITKLRTVGAGSASLEKPGA